nr:tetratricopeptide repeat protein [Pyrinomonadaceae bacterium]
NRDREAIDAFTRWAAAPAPIDGRFFQIMTNGRELSSSAAAARLGEALLRAGRTTEAVVAIRRAIALDSENDGYLKLLVQALKTGDGDERSVTAELQRMVAADPKNAVAVSLLSGIEARAGRIDNAIATLRAGIARRAANDRSQLKLRESLAQLLADALRHDEAIVVNEDLLKAQGAGRESLTAEEDRETIAKTLTRIINLQQQAGRSSDALASVERMRRLLGADDPNADLRFIELLREQGKRREALQALRTARERYPDQDMFVRLEAVTLAELGRVDEGVALLRGQLKGSLGDYPSYLTLSSIYLQAGRGNEAVEAARKALELVPPDQVDQVTVALLTLSSAQERAGNSKGSEESLRRILVKDPNNATALNNLGYFLLERNERLTEALEMIQRAVQVEPLNASFLDSLGWAYYKLNRLDEAERYLNEAARRDLTSATVQEHLGDVYLRRGRIDQARAAWQKALSLTSEAAETARIKAKLSSESRPR